MEPKIIQYLKRIVKTIAMGLLWMIVNAKIGIANNYAFYETKPSIANIVFYVWLVISLCALLFYFYKIWRVDLNFEEEEESF